eukprot:CAMPEP_0198215278 /NCGR_PEP_ID=MMETSP1445-20131203/48460_1 /TAXON_ID=36898 /ORGANISM="Pyramimonas sp., Strain CCMP2087" /LENGTH=37 /DNA_ID= /DNA_START= /DNA_END= /DNA_ORIENTATION=
MWHTPLRDLNDGRSRLYVPTSRTPKRRRLQPKLAKQA